MKAFTKTVGAVALVVVAIVIGVRGFGLGHKTDVTFTMSMAGGVCEPSDPETLRATKGQRVTWAVINQDCPQQYVSLQDFKHPTDTNTYDPPEHVLTPDQVTGGPVGTGQTVRLEAKVDRRDFWKRFKYQIRLGDTPTNLQTRRDPDIDVWPF